MMKSIKSILLLGVIFSGLLVGCNDGASIQKYYVEKQDNNNFISFDIPASIVSLDENASKEIKDALASIKKLNVLAFKINATNKDEFTAENKKVKEILKNEKFNELMRVKHQNVHIQVKYLGTDDTIDELILFASDNKKGFALARVLGDHMHPEKIIKLLNNVKDFDKDNPAIAQIEHILKEVE